MKKLLAIFIFALSLTLPATLLAQGMMGNWSNPPVLNNNFINPNTMMNFSFLPFGWIFMFFFWALVIIGIVTLIKWLTNQNKIADSDNRSALNILKDRYAKGEIDQKEFTEKKGDLQ